VTSTLAAGEVALAPARTLVKIPPTQDWQHAAATWMAFGTAWTGLVDIAHLSAGQTVLITAASSSAGLAAIQTARKVGANPVALTRTHAKAAALLEAPMSSLPRSRTSLRKWPG
jgi:NADPH:quinone reductase-like Zn-dependent oxidoreductase